MNPSGSEQRPVYLVLFFLLLIITGCQKPGGPLLYMDTSIHPGDDLWRYANGIWVPDSSQEVQTATRRASENFDEIIFDKLRQISDDDTVFMKLKLFYEAFIAEDRDTLNIGLRRELKLLDQFDSMEDLPALMALSVKRGYRSPLDVKFYGFSRTEYIAEVGPGRKEFSPDLKVDSSYFMSVPELMSEILPLAGISWDPERISRVTMLQGELNDVHHNHDSCATFFDLTGPDWLVQFSTALGNPYLIICSANDDSQIGEIIGRYDWNIWKDYFTWVWVEENLLFSNDEMVKIFSERINVFTDVDPLWYYRSPRRAVHKLYELFPDLMIGLYDYPPEQIAAIETMAEAVKAALTENIRQHAHVSMKDDLISRIEPIRFQIVKPAVIETYDKLKLYPDDPIGNYRNTQAYLFDMKTRFTQHPDLYQDHWLLESLDDVPTYLNSNQTVIIPISYAVPPHFSLAYEDAFNYGALGFYLGHEMAHALDFDRSPDLWEFDKRKMRLVSQYSNYYTNEGHFMDGLLSVNENFCDIVGLKAALTAYKEVIFGRTGLQRFFLGFANTQRDYRNPENQENYFERHPHAYSYLRVNGTVRNLDAFYEAFAVTPEDSLYLPPEDRIRFW